MGLSAIKAPQIKPINDKLIQQFLRSGFNDPNHPIYFLHLFDYARKSQANLKELHESCSRVWRDSCDSSSAKEVIKLSNKEFSTVLDNTLNNIFGSKRKINGFSPKQDAELKPNLDKDLKKTIKENFEIQRVTMLHQCEQENCLLGPMLQNTMITLKSLKTIVDQVFNSETEKEPKPNGNELKNSFAWLIKIFEDKKESSAWANFFQWHSDVTAIVENFYTELCKHLHEKGNRKTITDWALNLDLND